MNEGVEAAIAAPPSKPVKPHVSILLATCFGLGYLPKAPGTWGSAAGTLLSVALAWLSYAKSAAASGHTGFWKSNLSPTYGDLFVALLIAIVGVIVAHRAAAYSQISDPQWVVIDEVSGQLVTYYLFFFVLPLNWKSWLLGFILFRLFDIWKPFPARQLERLHGGLGIMADDWMAGIYAAIVLRVALHFKII
jgi:phosphatidylglycerophosphatase A